MTAVVFPGQGSQAPGMGRALFEAFPESRAVFQEVSGAVGFDVSTLCFASDEDTLRQTQNAQVALYVTGVAAFRALAANGVAAQAAAGHSVGEYAALAAAGVISVGSGARLVQERGTLMAESGKTTPGTMAAVLGLDREAVEKECAATEGVCVVANDNCPGQLVISGEVAAVASCGERLKAVGAKRVLPLNVSGAFHSPLMEAPAKKMADVLAQAVFSSTEVAVYSNVTARPATDWRALLEDQLRSPVRWTETVQNMATDGVRTFIECGHGNVLSGLIKRIAPESSILSVYDPESLDKTVAAVRGAAV